MVFDKVNTKNLEEEIDYLERRAKYLYHGYEEEGLSSNYDDVEIELAQKRKLLEALRRCAG